jgi:hypothetical protein
MILDAHTFDRLRHLVLELHEEAVVCARAGAFRGGCVLLGAALEGALLATAVTLESQLRSAGNWPKGDPLKWSLGDLLTVGVRAGWFPETPNVPPGMVPIPTQLGDTLRFVQWLRNLVHPGKFLREAAGVELDERLFSHAYETLDEAFDAVNAALLDALAEAE